MFDVDVCRDPVGIPTNRRSIPNARRFGQEHPVLGNQAVTAKDEVGGGFGGTGARISVGRDAPPRLSDDEPVAVFILADCFVARREVQQHVRASERLEGARRRRHPQVFADLDSHDDRSRFEQQIDAEWRLPSAKIDRRPLVTPRRGEPAALVELLVVRNVLLRHDSEHLPVEQHRRRVVEAVLNDDRQSDHHQLLPSASRCGQLQRLVNGGIKKRLLSEQVGARVARDAKFGKEHDVAIGDLVEHAANGRRVGNRIGDRTAQCTGGHPDKAKRIHQCSLLPSSAAAEQSRSGPASPQPTHRIGTIDALPLSILRARPGRYKAPFRIPLQPQPV